MEDSSNDESPEEEIFDEKRDRIPSREFEMTHDVEHFLRYKVVWTPKGQVIFTTIRTHSIIIITKDVGIRSGYSSDEENIGYQEIFHSVHAKRGSGQYQHRKRRRCPLT
ncbi:unnamed protein product [Lepeophtheirus salmonis]|uniref:(salmon louse) hypothetical protein n=1 Tax=Lepeophtheirus salmonis TaxID=72036 RepID=A0A7R8H5N3_LEPSM|nr:unnamed protein product [Lepeophtheirus salmonis]CAF2866775.1 unnamed protein product [Lepeophtheirus salmonis]